MRVLKRGYRVVLLPLIRRPLPAVVATAVLLIAGLVPFPSWAASCCPTSRNVIS